ncbi:MAG: putative tRNA-m1A22 methylase [Brockia lithotrophica]|uniref:Putative tRNA-m1A22 methylase n=1 Tax=Brockia lithotrophica TaxID=933949 RepID=A0A2T5G4I3_9BACL|nr:MAG: putative tRNA-m1A22 methylase [Brockia lithotrophica]
MAGCCSVRREAKKPLTLAQAARPIGLGRRLVYNENMGRLPPRLSALVRWIEPGSRLADVGTDHALLPRALLRSGRIVRAVGVEVLPHVVRDLEVELRREGYGDELEVRQGSGLSPLAPGEVDVVVIAGLGAETVRAILEEAGEKLATYRRLLVVPTDEAAPLRRWFYRHAVPLLDEEVVWDGGRGYEVLVASLAAYGDRAAARAPYDALVPHPLHLLFALGPHLYARRPEAWCTLWAMRLSRRAGRLESMARARTPEGIRRYRRFRAAYDLLRRALGAENFS